VQVGGVRKLTDMLSKYSYNRPHAAAAGDDDVGQRSAEVESQLLRTLATLCCVEDSVVQLHKVKLICLRSCVRTERIWLHPTHRVTTLP